MKQLFLLPNRLRTVGWFIFIPAFILMWPVALADFKFDWLHGKVFSILNPELGDAFKNGFVLFDDNLTNEVVSILLIIGGILVGFSKVKNEDEYISKIRLDALTWAVYINYLIVILSVVFIYGLPVLNVMFLNVFTILIIFIARFHYLLFKLKTETNEK